MSKGGGGGGGGSDGGRGLAMLNLILNYTSAWTINLTLTNSPTSTVKVGEAMGHHITVRKYATLSSEFNFFPLINSLKSNEIWY